MKKTDTTTNEAGAPEATAPEQVMVRPLVWADETGKIMVAPMRWRQVAQLIEVLKNLPVGGGL